MQASGVSRDNSNESGAVASGTRRAGRNEAIGTSTKRGRVAQQHPERVAGAGEAHGDRHVP